MTSPAVGTTSVPVWLKLYESVAKSAEFPYETVVPFGSVMSRVPSPPHVSVDVKSTSSRASAYPVAVKVQLSLAIPPGLVVREHTSSPSNHTNAS